MTDLTAKKNHQIALLGICIAAACIISSAILAAGALKITRFMRETISVTGTAQQQIRSDLVVWKGSFGRRSADFQEAYRALKEDLGKVRSYLLSKGVKEAQISVSQVASETIYKKNERGYDTNDMNGFRLTQTVDVQSEDVGLIERLSRESTELINDGVLFESQAPEYYYTKLDELKIDMLAKATQNAKQRAQNMAASTGARIGCMRAARMGVFQITPLNSTDVSNSGINDTSSLDKKVTAVVTVSFAIE